MMKVSEYAHVRLKNGLTGTIVEVLGDGEAFEFELDDAWEYEPDDVWRTVAAEDIAEIIEDAKD